MVKARRVTLSSITDLIRPTVAQAEPEWRQYISELENLSPGDAIEFTPDQGESMRTVMQRAARAAHSLSLNVMNYKTERGTVVTEVRSGTWQPKSKTPRVDGAPRRGRPPGSSRRLAEAES